MNRLTLTAQQFHESIDLTNEDLCSEDEIDHIEVRIDSEDEADVGANDDDDDNDVDDDGDYGDYGDDGGSILKPALRPSKTIEMLDLASFDIEPEIIYGRKTKTNRNPPFEWFDRPNSCLPSGINEFSAQIIEEFKYEKSIIFFFKKILNEEIISLITRFTNLRISLNCKSTSLNAKYLYQLERLNIEKITIVEMYAFIWAHW
jgi:hypothetical protein